MFSCLLFSSCSYISDSKRPVLTDQGGVSDVPYQTGMVLPTPKPDTPAMKCEFLQKGLASWYGHELAGNKTASGEMFNPDGISAAHRTLPFGTILHVTLDSGKGNPEGVYVRVNDRGPFKKARIIDLSWGAAKRLNMMDTQKVHVYKCT